MMLDRAPLERALAKSGPILVALSGGGDSVALLHLLAESVGARRLRAAIVDHGLRAGSADDARRALGFAQALGVDGAVLTLAGVKRAQAAARSARYAALCAEARARGADTIAVAHTADDQAETVLMRAAAGSSWRGLAGMAAHAPAPLWPEGRGVWLARPLLGVRRAALRAMLYDKDAVWIEDPANANTAFERVRVRQRLAALEAQGFDAGRLVALAARLGVRAAALDRAAAALVRAAVRFEADTALIDAAAWSGADAIRRRALAVLIVAAGGGAREPGADALARLAARLAAPSFKGGTLGGALIRRQGDLIALSRDPGALAGRADGALAPAPLALAAGVETVWDRRLAITAREPGWTLVAENGAPLLRRGDQTAPVQGRWLLAARVWRDLGAAAAEGE